MPSTGPRLLPTRCAGEYGRDREVLDTNMIEALERYLAQGPVSADLRGSVVAI